MTDMELTELEALAKAAAPGPWRQCKFDEKFVCSDDIIILNSDIDGEANAAYVAAANPAAVLELIAELRQARAERNWLAQLAANNIPTINDFVRATQGWLNAAKEATCPKN